MREQLQSLSVAERISRLHQSIPDSVRLIAVSKNFPPEKIREAYAAGVRDFGENRIQEALTKQASLQDLTEINWHFIGHLQRNKAKQAIAHFQWIHSVDSLALTQRLNTLGEAIRNPPALCLQVKLRDDPSKYGWTIKTLWNDLPKLYDCRGIKIRGIMTILPLGLSVPEQLATFEEAKQLALDLQQHPTYPIPTTELSMGMSGDFLAAIQAGATMVRLGRSIFGDRPLKPPPETRS